MRRSLLLLAAVLVFLTGCFSQRSLLKKLIPEVEDRQARRFIGFVQTGEIDQAMALLDGTVAEPQAKSGLSELHRLFIQSPLMNLETIGYREQRNFMVGQNQRRIVRLDYQVKLERHWLAGFVILVGERESLRINSARFNPIPASLETIHAFTLQGKGPGHYLILLAALLVPAMCLLALIVCIRSRIRRKWLWILFIILPLGKLSLNWTSGEWGYQVLAVQLMGSSIFKTGLYAPWVFAAGLPVGALIFLLKRKSLAPPVPPPTQIQ